MSMNTRDYPILRLDTN